MTVTDHLDNNILRMQIKKMPFTLKIFLTPFTGFVP